MSVANGAYTRTNLSPDAAKVYPRFHEDTVKDELASSREGREIFKTEERVEIIFPGNPHTKPVYKVAQEHIDRWPAEYKAFKEGKEMSADGVPLEQWPILKRAQVLELKSLGFRTVEEVANMSDLATQRIGMGGSRLRDLAKSYLDDEVQQALVAKATAENEALKRTVAEQGEQIKRQAQLLEHVSAQLLALQNAPSPIMTHIPGMHDPIAAAQQAQAIAPPAQSSLADLPDAPRRRGRPPGVKTEASAS